MVTIYSLSCPIDGQVKYIGLTSDSLEKRLAGHLANPTNGANYNWFYKLSKENKKPIIEYVDSCSDNKREGMQLESHWIQQFKSWGFDLNNGKRVLSDRKIRKEVKITDIPEKLFNKITENAEKNQRTQKAEVLFHLTKTYK